MTERDTHFRHAADFLLQEMSKRGFIGDDTALQYEEMQPRVAQFAYDLALHTWQWSEPEEVFSEIPDLAAWPSPPTTVE